jgi:hypothetical protein
MIKKKWMSTFLFFFLSVVFDVLFLYYCYDSLADISFYLSFAFYFSLAFLVIWILKILLLSPKKISGLFGKDMHQSLIDNGNIIPGGKE